MPYCSHSYYWTFNYEVTSDFKVSNVGKYKRLKWGLLMKWKITPFSKNSFLPPPYAAMWFLDPFQAVKWHSERYSHMKFCNNISFMAQLRHVVAQLRHCATSRKVAISIPDGVIGIFHWHNPSGCTMALGLTQPLTEMSTRNSSGEVKAADVQGWPYQLSWNMGASTSWNTQGLSRPVMGLPYPSWHSWFHYWQTDKTDTWFWGVSSPLCAE